MKAPVAANAAAVLLLLFGVFAKHINAAAEDRREAAGVTQSPIAEQFTHETNAATPVSPHTTTHAPTVTTTPVSNTTHAPNITTPVSNHTTAHAPNVTTTPVSNHTTTHAPNITTPVSNHTTTHAPNITTPVSNHTTTHAPNITTPVSNHTTTHAPNITTPVSNHTTTHAPNVTTAPPSNQTTPAPGPGPTLSPKPSSPVVGNYQVKDKNVCIKMDMGTELIVKIGDKKEAYFNIDPNDVKPNGSCGQESSTLGLVFTGGFVKFNFTKKDSSYYVSEVSVSLSPSGSNVGLQSATYSGNNTGQLFKTSAGNSFKCTSGQTVALGEKLTLKTFNLQLQAFDIKNGQFGKEEECSADRKKYIPVIVAVCVVVVIVVALIIYLIVRKRRNAGYERI